ncbi:MAG: LLM class F420-dependent oxidoreductase [Gammaproteobacteria bacterium]|nr:LLM class F420-dependent oxidoreductase [Gammaproteobacteria bacterium]
MFRAHVCMFATDRSIAPAELALAVEARGLDGVFFPEHTHMPVSSRSPFFVNGEVPEPYKRTCDPFIALAMAAAVTRRIALGTGICLVTEHDPLVLAKTVATLDHLSGGRVILGVGAGWNAEEMENHGTPYKERWPILRERILAMRTLWREEMPEFHGNYVSFDRLWSWPKPVRPQGPPIWLGSNSRFVPDRVAEYGDGWMPIVGRAGEGNVERLKQACQRYGRRMKDVTLALFYAPRDEDEGVERLREGYTDFIFGLPSGGPDEVLPVLDELATLAARLRAAANQ